MLYFAGCCRNVDSKIKCKIEGVIVALTKADIAEKLFDDLGLNKREAKEIVELFFEEIKEFTGKR
jgi:hypothetical protein